MNIRCGEGLGFGCGWTVRTNEAWRGRPKEQRSRVVYRAVVGKVNATVATPVQGREVAYGQETWIGEQRLCRGSTLLSVSVVCCWPREYGRAGKGQGRLVKRKGYWKTSRALRSRYRAR